MTKLRLALPLLLACGCADDRPRRALEAGDLGREATRLMNNEDGPGCLASLDKARERDPQTEAMFAHVRAQCEMLSGQCQAGKRRLDRYYQEMARMPPETRARSIDGVCSMWCRGGDMDTRDQLNQALFELSQGAYISRKDPRFCRERFELARKLLPEVSPGAEGDDSIRAAPASLHFTAAQCFARADDCDAAFSVYTDDDAALVRTLLAAPVAPEARAEALRGAFRSSFPGCPSPG